MKAYMIYFLHRPNTELANRMNIHFVCFLVNCFILKGVGIFLLLNNQSLDLG